MNYNWKRYWTKRGEPFPMDYDGYLIDNSDRKEDKELVLFDSIKKPCLVLLGEPGIGKSRTLLQEVNKLKKQLAQTKDDVQLVDLRDVFNRGELKEDLFDKEFFCNWLEGNHHLHLFLDSFDESLMQYQALASLLGKRLNEYKKHIHRLTLRIASRIGLWTIELENELKKLWGKELFGVYQLSPLRKKDVIIALRMEKVPEEKVLQEIKTKNLISFAIRPVTLKMLIDSYKTGEDCLPDSKIQIYEQGCSFLCDEINYNRKIKRICNGKLNEVERYQIASKIALITIFCNRNIINTKFTIGNLSHSEITLSEIKSICKNTSNQDIEEVLSTGLFTGRGKEKVGWAHLTYAEFMAANYVNRYFNVGQILNLLSHSCDSKGKIIPQLHATAAWIAGMNKEIFSEILKRDHNVLFLCDFSNINDNQKRELVDKFLNTLDRGDNTNFYANLNTYENFYHENIEKQIRSFINDKENNEYAKIRAIEIAFQCNLINLKNDILNLALNSHGAIQEKAIFTYLKYVNDCELINLKPLVIEQNYLNDYIISVVLSKLRDNDLINIYELMERIIKFNIRQTSDENRIFDFIKNFSKDEINKAIIWIIHNLDSYKSADSFDYFIDYVILIGVDFKSCSEIQSNLEELMLLRYKNTGRVTAKKSFNFIYLSDDNKSKRYKLIILLLNLEKQFNIPKLILNEDLIVFDKDIEWLNLCKTKSELIHLKDRFNEIIKEVENKEKQAIWNRKLLIKDPNEVRKEVLKLDTSEKNVIFSWVEFCNGSLFKNSLLLELIVKDKKIDYLLVDDKTTEKLVDISIKYIMRYIVQEKDWINTYSKEANASQNAFHILLKNKPEIIENLPIEIWRNWAPIIIYYPYMSLSEYKCNEEILKVALRANFELIVNEFLNMIDKMTRIDSVVRDFCYTYWNDRLGEALLNKILDNELDMKKKKAILGVLLEKGYRKGEEYAETLISIPISKDIKQREQSVMAAICLMGKAKNAGWNSVWIAIQNDIEFGVEVMYAFLKSYSDGLRIGNVIYNKLLKCKQLKDFYIWIETNIIRMKKIENEYYSIREWKAGILQELKERGTIESYKQIEWITKVFPADLEANQMWLYVQNDYLKNSWVPYFPKDIVKLQENEHNKLVDNGDQLISVLIESLNRLQEKLQGETPAVIDLWNDLGKGKFKPIHENDFSDYVKRHLDDDLQTKGIIVNREVEIRKGYGVGKGERTDIHVNAVVKNLLTHKYDKITVIIEVKGCWHSEINKAMETQLLDEYLNDNQCNHGIYLIGWFYCKQWKTSKTDIKIAKQQFHDQADKLSKENNLNIKAYVMNTALRE